MFTLFESLHIVPNSSSLFCVYSMSWLPFSYVMLFHFVLSYFFLSTACCCRHSSFCYSSGSCCCSACCFMFFLLVSLQLCSSFSLSAVVVVVVITLFYFFSYPSSFSSSSLLFETILKSRAICWYSVLHPGRYHFRDWLRTKNRLLAYFLIVIFFLLVL